MLRLLKQPFYSRETTIHSQTDSPMNLILFPKLLWTMFAGILVLSCGRQEQDLETLEDFARSFRITEQADVHILQDNGSWLLQAGDGEPAAIDPAGENIWYIPELETELFSTKNSEGHRTIY